MQTRYIIAVFLSLWLHTVYALDPLPSWNEGANKKSIIEFVAAVTNKSNPQYVSPEDRIATFDNDGTLWLEQPMYTQVMFAISRVKTLAPQHPEWKTQKPFSDILSGNTKALANISHDDLEKIVAETHSGMSVEDFIKIVQDWLASARDPHYGRQYTQLIYQPMLEVMNYLRANDFKIYIVTGGGQDFVRAFAPQTYGVVTAQIIGTAMKTNYMFVGDQPKLIRQPQVLLYSNYSGKAEAIDLFIGKKPIIAFGNSDGDRQMLEWTQANKKAHLMLLVHHDDAKREYAYGPNSPVGRFSNSLMQEALKNHWRLISMKDDWKVIFPLDKK